MFHSAITNQTTKEQNYENTKHTPAPWNFRKWSQSDEEIEQMKKFSMNPTPSQTNEGQVFVSCEAGGPDEHTNICLVTTRTRAKKKSEQWMHQCEERDANARLIAAAPKLLEALIAARSEIWELVHHCTSDEKYKEQYGFIDEIIAKAKGE